MTGGTLLGQVQCSRPLSEAHSKFYCASVILGLEQLHSRGILHRDIKPDNALIDADGYCRISDLGLAVRLGDCPEGGWKEVVGTLNYFPPELASAPDQGRGTQTVTSYGYELDAWELGVTLYNLLQAEIPFAQKDHACLRAGDVSKPPTRAAAAAGPLQSPPLPTVLSHDDHCCKHLKQKDDLTIYADIKAYVECCKNPGGASTALWNRRCVLSTDARAIVEQLLDVRMLLPFLSVLLCCYCPFTILPVGVCWYAFAYTYMHIPGCL